MLPYRLCHSDLFLWKITWKTAIFRQQIVWVWDWDCLDYSIQKSFSHKFFEVSLCFLRRSRNLKKKSSISILCQYLMVLVSKKYHRFFSNFVAFSENIYCFGDLSEFLAIFLGLNKSTSTDYLYRFDLSIQFPGEILNFRSLWCTCRAQRAGTKT